MHINSRIIVIDVLASTYFNFYVVTLQSAIQIDPKSWVKVEGADAPGTPYQSES